MKKQDKIISYISNLFEIFSVGFLVCILFAVVLQIFFRYVIRIAVPWTEETARYLCIGMVFTGVVALVAQEGHIRITFILNRVSKKINYLLSLLAYICTLIFNVIVLLGSIHLVRLNWEQQAVTLPISVGVLYLTVGISSFFILILLPLLIIKLKGFFTNNTNKMSNDKSAN